MVIKIKEAEDKNKFEDKVAYLKAYLMQEYINKLDVNKETRIKIKKELIKKLQMTWII